MNVAQTQRSSRSLRQAVAGSNLGAGSSLALFLALSFFASSAQAQEKEGVKPPENYGGFVSADGTKLKLNGGDFYFSGANSYAMLYSPDEAEETMRVARDLGLNAIRFWGFWDGEEPTYDQNGEQSLPPGGTDRWGRPVLQSKPREYNEIAFRNFDQVVYLAHLYGIKLVIPLLNEWDEFGGLKQYLTWGGFQVPDLVRGCGPDGEDVCFYANEDAIKAERFRFFVECQECKDIYFDFVTQVLNRVNTITGVKYKDDPAIMIWEVMNEPRYGPWRGDDTATVIRDFLREGAQLIKSIDKNHMVATGEEGFFFEGEFEHYMGLADGMGGAPAANKTGYGWDTAPGEGTSFVLNSEIPEVDIATYHAWPFNWNKAAEQWGEQYAGRIDEFMVEWVDSHAAAAQSIGKPVFLGEFGWQILRRPGSDVPDRDKILKAIYDRILATDTAGVMYWNITARHDPDEAVYQGPIERTRLEGAIYEDDPIPHDQVFRFDIYCPEDKSTCAIIREATALLTGKIENPDPPFTGACFTPRTECGDECVLLDSSPDHCGACGNPCAEEETCRKGTCEARGNAEWDASQSPYATEGGCSFSHPNARGRTSPLALVWALGLLILARRPRPSVAENQPWSGSKRFHHQICAVNESTSGSGTTT